MVGYPYWLQDWLGYKEEEDILCAPTGEAEPQVVRMDARREADVASRQSGIHRHPQERLLLLSLTCMGSTQHLRGRAAALQEALPV